MFSVQKVLFICCLDAQNPSLQERWREPILPLKATKKPDTPEVESASRAIDTRMQEHTNNASSLLQASQIHYCIASNQENT